MKKDCLSKYKVMWIFCFFDLPTNTPKERSTASKFRNKLLKDGFKMMQFSVYTRHSASWENAQVHIKRIEQEIPANGHIIILPITDKQYEQIKNFSGRKIRQVNSPIQLTLL